MYAWRQMSAQERTEVLAARLRAGRAWHRPPHFRADGPAWFHVSAACYEHAPHIGQTPQRMDAFADSLLAACAELRADVAAWCLLPNHYHLLARTPDLRAISRELGRLHGRASHDWNQEQATKGRRVFHGASDRRIRSDEHHWATLNYIHHNPVRHGYVTRWQDWPWSSAAGFLRAVGRAEAQRIWRTFPLLDYGAGWDAPEL
jgi:putative transposase